MKTIKDSLRDALRLHTYPSSIDGRERSLMLHQIDYLLERTLLPWLEIQGLLPDRAARDVVPSPPSTPDLDDLLPDPEPRLAGEEGEDG